MSSCATVLPRPQTGGIKCDLLRIVTDFSGETSQTRTLPPECDACDVRSLKQADAYLQYDKFQCRACVESRIAKGK
jgi:hypothetical protein